MDYKVGDKVRVRSELVGGGDYNAVYFSYGMLEFCGKEYIISKYENDTNISLEWNDLVCDRKRSNEMLEPVNIKTVVTRPTYERKAERSDGITFERNAIWGRSLKEIEESIAQRKESIKRDESLLRSHRSLFSKKK